MLAPLPSRRQNSAHVRSRTSRVMARALQYFDLVAVRIGHEEEPRQHLPLALQFLDRGRREAEPVETLMLAGKIRYRHRYVAVACAVRIGLAARVIEGQLELKFAFPVL